MDDVSPEGARIEVSADGVLSTLHIVVPEGWNDGGEVAYVGVELSEVTETDLEESPESGAVGLGAFSINVYPESLGEKLLAAADIRITVDLDQADVTDVERNTALSDLDAWSSSQLVLAGPDHLEDNLDTASNGSCARQRQRKRYTFRAVDAFEPIDSTSPSRRVELAVRRLPPGALYRGVVDVPNSAGTRSYVYWVLEPTVSWTSSQGKIAEHFGFVDFRYFPVSAISGTARTPFPEDHEQVQVCFAQIFDVLADVLSSSGFRPIKADYRGQSHGIDVFFYDYATDPVVGATTNMRHRVIYLPTWMLEIPAAGCLTSIDERPNHRHAFASIAHEVFHLQQAASVAPLDAHYGARIDDLQQFEDVPTPVRDLGSGRVVIQDYPATKWLTESTARYFEQTIVPPIDPSGIQPPTKVERFAKSPPVSSTLRKPPPTCMTGWGILELSSMPPSFWFLRSTES